MAYYSKSSHIGSCLSIVDILYSLYFKILNIDPFNPEMANRDKFILSKGHASAALYATLAERGFFPMNYLDKYYIDGGILPGHLDKESAPGIEISAGSLGHGLSIGLGMAIANRQTGNPGRIFVLLGDGECNEGSIWEAAMLAGTLKLSNLTVIVDLNGLQGMGCADKIITQEKFGDRWVACNWHTLEVDGHDQAKLEQALNLPVNAPKAVLAHTIKGKGVSFMEGRMEWHYKSPNEQEYNRAIEEVENPIEKCFY